MLQELSTLMIVGQKNSDIILQRLKFDNYEIYDAKKEYYQFIYLVYLIFPLVFVNNNEQSKQFIFASRFRLMKEIEHSVAQLYWSKTDIM